MQRGPAKERGAFARLEGRPPRDGRINSGSPPIPENRTFYQRERVRAACGSHRPSGFFGAIRARWKAWRKSPAWQAVIC